MKTTLVCFALLSSAAFAGPRLLEAEQASLDRSASLVEVERPSYRVAGGLMITGGATVLTAAGVTAALFATLASSSGDGLGKALGAILLVYAGLAVALVGGLVLVAGIVVAIVTAVRRSNLAPAAEPLPQSNPIPQSSRDDPRLPVEGLVVARF